MVLVIAYLLLFIAYDNPLPAQYWRGSQRSGIYLDLIVDLLRIIIAWIYSVDKWITP